MKIDIVQLSNPTINQSCVCTTQITTETPVASQDIRNWSGVIQVRLQAEDGQATYNVCAYMHS